MSTSNPHLSAELLREASFTFRDQALRHFEFWRGSRHQRAFWREQTRKAIKHSRACALAASYIKPASAFAGCLRFRNWNQRRLALIAARESESAFRIATGIPSDTHRAAIEREAAQILEPIAA